MPAPPRLFSDPDATIAVTRAETGSFFGARRPTPAARFAISLGKPHGWRRAVALFRYEPFWMKPRPVARVDDVPPDTQLLLIELDSGAVAIVAPLVAAPFHVSLRGGNGVLEAVADTGDPTVLGTEALLAYVAVGDDIFALSEHGAREVAERLGGVGLRRDRPLPAFVDDFGWCTWDAFYQEVSHAKVEAGLASFRAGGVEPRALILDDGWQRVDTAPTGERRLLGFEANEKFPGGLRATVRLAKEAYGVRNVLVWHAVHGYWGGLDEALGYGVTPTSRWYSPEVLAHFPAANWEYWGARVGRPARERLAAFYDDYHHTLAAEGVDGVKVDNQASIEGVAHGAGGRVAYAQATRAALEASVERHFAGQLVNCMSCSTDLVYQARRFGLTRASTDFWPNRPESHGLHAYTNALVGVWFGEFLQPDWDMFQSGHAAGAFHAAMRAVSGGPVYVSDKPDAHDFALLQTLVLADGSVLRARGVGRPTRDCLFEDPLAGACLLKVWNENVGAGVIGVFNASSAARLEGGVSPGDVPTLEGPDFAVYRQRARTLVRAQRNAKLPLALAALEAEIVTIVPIDRGVAPLGLIDKLNSGGAVTEKGWSGSAYRVSLRGGGTFGAFLERPPQRVRVDGQSVEPVFDGALLRVDLDTTGVRVVAIEP